jgi:16S rRNA (cytosine1402-N4)-methyltransferase
MEAAMEIDREAIEFHDPVMTAEIRSLVCDRNPSIVVDATVGTGGHAALILQNTAARLVAIDRDQSALVVSEDRLRGFGGRVIFHHRNFSEIDWVLDQAGDGRADAIIADFGLSSFALDNPGRGLSLRHDGPLDMRMDCSSGIRAHEIVNEESETELARIIYEYGEERAARRIARMIVEARRRGPIETTGELRAIVERALGAGRRGKVHPATRTFQALRIRVNSEIEALREFLEKAPLRLAPSGRLITIAYHSLEDRPVKERFRELVRAGEFIAVTGKPMRPSEDEVARNPRARSARLRCIERGAR